MIALRHFHKELNVSHNNLKPTNILISANLSLKVSDYKIANFSEKYDIKSANNTS